MDSRLDSLFRHLPRRAESADARSGIRRDDRPEPDRKKDGRDRDRGADDAPEDRMSVSVATLILFLENLLGESLGAAAPPVAPGPPPVTPGARAAQAYQAAEGQGRSGGHAVSAAASASGSRMQGAEGGGPAAVLGPEERREISQLLAVLQERGRAGVAVLDIEWRGGFLDSIRAALDASGIGADDGGQGGRSL